jgi:phospholipid/cholesterol/gamma-HCH transport system substrate-binding protein
MRLSARQMINVLLIASLGIVALAWAAMGLARIRPFEERATIWVTAPAAGGALPGAEVTYLGVAVGRVASAELDGDVVRVRLDVDANRPMATVLRASIRQKSALGEPYVDLAPATSDVAAAEAIDGMEIPLDRVDVPAELNSLLQDADQLLADVDPADVATIVDGLSGFVGNEAAFRDLVANSADVASELSSRRAELESLISSAATLASTLDARRGDLAAGIVGFDRLSGVLTTRTAELEQILRSGAELGTNGTGLVTDIRDDLAGVLGGLDTVTGELARRPVQVAEISQLTPLMITRFGLTFDGSNFWLSAGGATPFFPGLQPRYGVPIYGQGLRIDRIVAPSIAQRVLIDLGGEQPAVAYQLLGPEDSAAAASSPAALLAAQERGAAQFGVVPPPEGFTDGGSGG